MVAGLAPTKDTMRTELFINDPRCERIKLVPDEYKPKPSRESQQEGKARDKDEVKIYPWDCGTPRVLLESEKLVPKSYRPRDNDNAQFVSNSDGDCLRDLTVVAQGKFGDAGYVMQAFKRCIDDPNLEVGIVARKRRME